MATNTVPNVPARLRLCIQAAYRIEALAHLLKRNASNDSDEDPFVTEELSQNIADLAAVVMSAAGDENDPAEEIAKRLYRGHQTDATEGEQQAAASDRPVEDGAQPAAIDDLLGDSADNLWDAVSLLKSLQARVSEMETTGAIHIDQRVEICRGMRITQGLIEREASRLPDLGWAPQGTQQ
jgi:hypothetical protein